MKRAGTSLEISFAAVRGASSYLVVLKLSSGQRELFVLKRDRGTLPGVFGDITGSVSVRAAGDHASVLNGPPAIMKFRAAPHD